MWPLPLNALMVAQFVTLSHFVHTVSKTTTYLMAFVITWSVLIGISLLLLREFVKPALMTVSLAIPQDSA